MSEIDLTLPPGPPATPVPAGRAEPEPEPAPVGLGDEPEQWGHDLVRPAWRGVDGWFDDDYPGGSRQEFANPTTLAWKREPSLVVLHTTEGGGYPSAGTYQDGRSAPHATVDPWARTFRQHYSLNEAAWSLKAPPGVSTNTMGAVQLEVVGTSDPRNGALASAFVPSMPDGPMGYLAGLVKLIADRLGVPMTSSVTWVPYPASYGNGGGQRLATSTWYGYRGILGHEHVPGNDHGDPGAFDVGRLLALAGGALPTPGPAGGAVPSAAGGIVEDGVWGSATTTKAQQVLSTYVDGEVWHQYKPNAQPGLTSGWVYDWEPGTAGSPLIVEMMRRTAAAGQYDGAVDGVAGRKFYMALQRRYGTVVDGEIWLPSPAVRAMQATLNAGDF
ncbi:hypothetical protein Cch01nite_00010 [Cellulomonas chitinilytica]|uniref:N-acetylmuramoyl-L-alanine amidase domain-containing protein n=1 Tax=Cellulomonas chitinilytica TaxID=398759 RepID=A0A919NZC1_9CELL|nr:hypothetical protein [Cellulomonas chitinilytica]GIG19277.1 hypothetical protein Cch01nite_00010 [Cellulomonas chitinilytica]